MLSSLTNGVQHWFIVRGRTDAVQVVGPGPWSNIVLGTPYGPVATPTPSALPGDGEARLFWPEPDSGGHPGPLTYTVVYRPVGSSTWFAGPAGLSARTTLITGLDNGVDYEFGVIASATDAASGEAGTATTRPNALEVKAEPGVVGPGNRLLASAAGFCPGVPVTFFLDGVERGTNQSTSDGLAVLPITAPGSEGTYELRAEAPSCERISGPAATTGDVRVEWELPATGASFWPMLLVGGGLVLVGNALTRRRRPA